MKANYRHSILVFLAAAMLNGQVVAIAPADARIASVHIMDTGKYNIVLDDLSLQLSQNCKVILADGKPGTLYNIRPGVRVKAVSAKGGDVFKTGGQIAEIYIVK